jgi:hypothetical protein
MALRFHRLRPASVVVWQPLPTFVVSWFCALKVHHTTSRKGQFNKKKVPCDTWDFNPEKREMPNKAALLMAGKTIGISASEWPGGAPGPAYDGVERVGDKLIFMIHRPRGGKCTVHAVLKGGPLREKRESFLLTPERAAKLRMDVREKDPVARFIRWLVRL